MDRSPILALMLSVMVVSSPSWGIKVLFPKESRSTSEDLTPKVDAEILGGLSGHVIIEGKRVILVLLSKRALHPVTPSSHLKHQAPAVDAAIPGTVMLLFDSPCFLEYSIP